MWSTSADAACRGPDQMSSTAQFGQLVSPSRRALLMTLRRTFFHCVVAVRGVCARCLAICVSFQRVVSELHCVVHEFHCSVCVGRVAFEMRALCEPRGVAIARG